MQIERNIAPIVQSNYFLHGEVLKDFSLDGITIDEKTKLPIENDQLKTILENNFYTTLTSGKNFSMMYCDLDQLKALNENCGFSSGDRFIKTGSRLILKEIKKIQLNDGSFGLSYRKNSGGDEFVTCFFNIDEESEAKINNLAFEINKFRKDKKIKKQKLDQLPQELSNIANGEFEEHTFSATATVLSSFDQSLSYLFNIVKNIRSASELHSLDLCKYMSEIANHRANRIKSIKNNEEIDILKDRIKDMNMKQKVEIVSDFVYHRRMSKDSIKRIFNEILLI